MLTSLIVFTLLYGILAVIEVGLVVKYVKIGPPSEAEALLRSGVVHPSAAAATQAEQDRKRSRWRSPTSRWRRLRQPIATGLRR